MIISISLSFSLSLSIYIYIYIHLGEDKPLSTLHVPVDVYVRT